MQVVKMTDPENYETSANQLRKRMPTGSCVGRSRLQPESAGHSGTGGVLKRLGNEQSGKGVPKLFRTDRLWMQQRLLAWRENYRKGILLSIEFPTLRHTREFLPRFRPLDTEQLSLRLAGKQRPAGLCKGDRLQSLHQRTERR